MEERVKLERGCILIGSEIVLSMAKQTIVGGNDLV